MTETNVALLSICNYPFVLSMSLFLILRDIKNKTDRIKKKNMKII